MLLKWCLAATRTKRNDSSILAVDMNAAYSAAPAFATWQRQELDSTLCHQSGQAPHVHAGWGT